jgi:hypothetical protein
MGSMTGLRLRSQARAIWLGVAWWGLAMASIEPLFQSCPVATGIDEIDPELKKAF